MDWMYKGVTGLVDREEYLKGRKIDKTFEIIEKEENNIKGDFESFDAQIPQSLFDNNNSEKVTVDLAAKLREDPLYEIRVKQREQRRKLLDNPLKLKKLKTILESTLSKDKHKKKSKRQSSSSEESDAKHRNKDKRKSYTNSSSRQSDSLRHKSNESSRERDRHKDKSHNREHSRKDDHKYDHKSRFDDRNRNYYSKHNSRSNDGKHKSNKLSEEELEKKRMEMMNNAVWREVNRKSNVKSFNDKELEETKFNESAKSAQFIKPLLKSATESYSLETRIKQKRFTSQRNHNSMDTNFAKKS